MLQDGHFQSSPEQQRSPSIGIGTERCLRISGESSQCMASSSAVAVGCDDPRTVAGTLSLPLAGLLSCTVEAACR